MDQNALKQEVGKAAVQFVQPGEVLGVGTGTTVDYFIDALSAQNVDIPAAVSSSTRSTEKLIAAGIKVIDLNDAGPIGVYIDGADEINAQLHMLKGGGGALTREKIIAAASEKFVCIADESKQVHALGAFPLPVEVVPMARSYVARKLVALGGKPVLRAGFVTDNGNVILDVEGLTINEPVSMEKEINQIAGVVTNGLFALRPADILLVGNESGIRTVTAP